MSRPGWREEGEEEDEGDNDDDDDDDDNSSGTDNGRTRRGKGEVTLNGRRNGRELTVKRGSVQFSPLSDGG